MANKRNYAKELNILIETFTHEDKRPTLLLHACCAPCSSAAIRWGVHRVFIIDGRVPHAILIEMLTNEGIGTMFVAGQGGKTDEHSAT